MAKRYLIRGGYRGGKSESTLTAADNHLLTVRERDNATYAGAIAGKKAGRTEFNGERILVTRGPRLPIVKKGGERHVADDFEAQFGTDGLLAFEWLRRAHLRVHNGGGQARHGPVPAGGTLPQAAAGRPLRKPTSLPRPLLNPGLLRFLR